MIKREEFGKKFIYIVFVLWLCEEMFLNTTIEYVFMWKKSDINDMVAYFVLMLLLVQIVFFQSYKVNELIVISFVTCFIAYATINSGHNTMMATWIFIVAAKNIDFDRIVGLAYYVQMIVMGIILYMFFNGYIRDYVVYRGSIVRHSLGFTHPNQLGLRIFLIMVCRCYHRKDRLNFFDIVLVLASAFFVNKVTNSKTSFVALIVLAGITAIYVLMELLCLNMSSFSDWLILIAIVSNVGSIIMSTINVNRYPILKNFDFFMSKRFSHCYRTMKYYGVSLFGQKVELIVKRPVVGAIYHFFLDNAYMAILLRYGVIVFCLFSMLYILAMIYLKKTRQFYLLGIMCLYSIYGIMETNYFSMAQNLFLLVLSFPIFRYFDNRDTEKNHAKFKVVW